MKNVFGLFMVLITAFGFSGCATIVSGTTQKISVTSHPSDATVTVDHNLSSKTPASFTLERKVDHAIEISKEGYKSTTILIKRTFNGMATGNILLGGIIGAGIDAASGSTNKLVPERVDVILEQGEGFTAIPRFAAQKDQDYYEKNILKNVSVAAQTDKPIETSAQVAAPTKTNFTSK